MPNCSNNCSILLSSNFIQTTRRKTKFELSGKLNLSLRIKLVRCGWPSELLFEFLGESKKQRCYSKMRPFCVKSGGRVAIKVGENEITPIIDRKTSGWGFYEYSGAHTFLDDLVQQIRSVLAPFFTYNIRFDMCKGTIESRQLFAHQSQ